MVPEVVSEVVKSMDSGGLQIRRRKPIEEIKPGIGEVFGSHFWTIFGPFLGVRLTKHYCDIWIIFGSKSEAKSGLKKMVTPGSGPEGPKMTTFWSTFETPFLTTF